MWTLYRLNPADPNRPHVVLRQRHAPPHTYGSAPFGTGGGSAYVWLWEED